MQTIHLLQIPFPEFLFVMFTIPFNFTAGERMRTAAEHVKAEILTISKRKTHCITPKNPFSLLISRLKEK